MKFLRNRRRPSPALIVAIAALSVSLVGTAVAVPIAEISLSKKEKRIVRKISRNISARVSNRRITKRAPGLSVASANTANSANSANTANSANSANTANSANSANTANSANSADNANTVGGNRIVRFSFNVSAPTGQTKILDVGGLQLYASCAGGAVTTVAKTTVADGEISAFSYDASSESSASDYNDAFDPGDEFTLPQSTPSDEIGQGRYIGGDLNAVHFTYTEEDLIGGNSCIFNGFATSG